MSTQASSSSFTSENFDHYNTHLQANALKATRSALALPADISFHRSMDSSFSQDLEVFSSKVLSLTNNLLSLVATADTTQLSRIKGKAKLEDQDDVVDNFHSMVVDSMDQLLERTDICLDEYLGQIRAPAIVVNPAMQPIRKNHSVSQGQLDPAIQHASHLVKPQLSFKRKVENNELPWYPSLSHKYHAQLPLGYVFRDTDSDANDTILLTTHPYRYEITHISYPTRMFQAAAPTLPKSFNDTPYTWVSDVQGLQALLVTLRQSTEIAVDLEHHSYRSYNGFLCLMQISTREADYIIDTLVLRDELTELNEIFTDPKIIKVFHGADSDIVWLQQDFNLYVVNLFDTYHASKILEFPRHGLANLLEMYCDFTPDKRYQLADWRIRPLPKEMLEYARSDTHFLLYIYDNLRNALLDRALSRSQSMSPSGSPTLDPSDLPHILIKQVLARSEETALKTYEKEMYDVSGGRGSNGWDTLARKWNKGALLAGGPGVGVGALQRAVYICIHRWRDSVAQEEDESTRYVLPNHFLFQLAEHPPADMAALLKVFHAVPPVIRRRAKELLDVIRDCLNRHLSRTSAPPTPGNTEGSSSDLHIDEAEIPNKADTAPTTDARPLNIWSPDSKPPAVTSLLFGSALVPPTRPSANVTHSLIAPKSSLFGNMIQIASASASTMTRPGITRFQELVAQINTTLVIIPSVPQVAVKDGTDSIKSNVDDEAILGMEVEIPYVPASQRNVAQSVDDSIVVVGQARQRKRKRVKASVTGTGLPGEAPSPNLVNQTDDILNDESASANEPFDFSAVPNILDDNPNIEDIKKRRKQKKQKTGGAFYGDFPAPPKAYSELKRGNQSHTFK
ncbi:hypothetical protein BDZ94DRAFT_1304497 [Collybia nuda]|uniref:HRDC domain-containing protein n=1 Tax=Collybia nuda TaxID=64659 RepID=A0A9P5YH05_9AGAR|nr:hypothetical protein BDZ94DRAFT_1304497 [Collybia nuda]